MRSGAELRAMVDRAHRQVADEWRRRFDAAEKAELLAREQADRRYLLRTERAPGHFGPRR